MHMSTFIWCQSRAFVAPLACAHSRLHVGSSKPGTEELDCRHLSLHMCIISHAAGKSAPCRRSRSQHLHPSAAGTLMSAHGTCLPNHAAFQQQRAHCHLALRNYMAAACRTPQRSWTSMAQTPCACTSSTAPSCALRACASSARPLFTLSDPQQSPRPAEDTSYVALGPETAVCRVMEPWPVSQPHRPQNGSACAGRRA